MGDWKCDQCEKLFTSQSILDRHCSIEHPKGDVYKCVDCDKVLSKKEDLIDHMKAHPVSKPYSCKQCNKEFSRKYHLDRHVYQTGCSGVPKQEFKCQVLKFKNQVVIGY